MEGIGFGMAVIWIIAFVALITPDPEMQPIKKDDDQ